MNQEARQGEPVLAEGQNAPKSKKRAEKTTREEVAFLNPSA